MDIQMCLFIYLFKYYIYAHDRKILYRIIATEGLL